MVVRGPSEWCHDMRTGRLRYEAKNGGESAIAAVCGDAAVIGVGDGEDNSSRLFTRLDGPRQTKGPRNTDM
jgi:hypothetical protein